MYVPYPILGSEDQRLKKNHSLPAMPIQFRMWRMNETWINFVFDSKTKFSTAQGLLFLFFPQSLLSYSGRVPWECCFVNGKLREVACGLNKMAAETSVEESQDVTMEENTPSKDQGVQKMFTLKKWNAVAMWSWDVECDTCAICRVQVMGEFRSANF